MPMVPELPVTMLACARLGVIHSEVFGGFSGTACGEPHRRLRQPRPDRRGQLLPGRQDDRPQGQGRRGPRRGGQGRPGSRQGAGLAAAPGPVRLADPDGRRPGLLRRRSARGVRRADRRAGLHSGRGAAVPDVHQRDHRPPEGLPAQHRRLPTSCVAGASKYYQDIHPDDVYWCMADIGWITGHSYIVYGPLALGTTTVIYEGVPNYPDERPAVADQQEKLGVNIFHTSPTAIRMLRKVQPGGAAETQLPLQEPDDRRRADRARGLGGGTTPRSARARRRSPTPGGRPRTAASSAAPYPPCSR